MAQDPDRRKSERTDEELEYERTHPEWLADMPPAPPEVTASQYEGTRTEEAGRLPKDERERK